MGGGETEKETWTNNFVYAIGGIGDNLMHYIRVKPTSNDVSINFYSCAYLLIPQLSNSKNRKLTLLIYMSFVLLLIHTQSVLVKQ